MLKTQLKESDCSLRLQRPQTDFPKARDLLVARPSYQELYFPLRLLITRDRSLTQSNLIKEKEFLRSLDMTELWILRLS